MSNQSMGAWFLTDAGCPMTAAGGTFTCDSHVEVQTLQDIRFNATDSTVTIVYCTADDTRRMNSSDGKNSSQGQSTSPG